VSDGQTLFDRARDSVTRTYIEGEFGTPGAHWRRGKNGDEYMTLNPTRSDNEIGSFSIREDGKWFDYASSTGGDLFDLIAARDGISPVEAARAFLGDDVDNTGHYEEVMPVTTSDPLKPLKIEGLAPDWRPVPADRPPVFHTTPDHLTLFYSEDGKPQYYVVRYNKNDRNKKKIIYPVYWSGSRYYIGLPPNLPSRTLLPFDKSRPVVLLEGERKTEVARSFDRDKMYSYTSWHGGSGQAERIDLTILTGCKVILFPDADEASRKCFKRIAERLQGVASEVRIVKGTKDLRKGYDIADYIADQRDVFMVIATSEDYQYETPIDVVPREADKTNLTDLGNAERFVAMFGDQVRYNIDKNRWMIWNGRYWSDDDQSQITPMVKMAIRSMINEYPDDKSVYAHTMISESASKIAAMLKLATQEQGIGVKEDSLDSVPHIFVAANGTIDLKKGAIATDDPSHLCSKTSDVIFNPGAKAPRFQHFLTEIMDEEEDKIEFLQRWFGYSLTADTSAQSFLIMYGTGANGKSTLVELIARVVGGYARSAPPDTFVVKQTGGIPNDVASLRGSRIVLATETEANARLAESRMKYMTGGDRVSARYLRAEFFEFTPQWKIIISTNHRPRVSGGDFGIWRRVILLPFKFQADGEKLDPLLPNKLWEEREGILAWMVEGARKWYEDGMGRAGLLIPKSVLAETQEYRIDEDLIGRFISEECVTGLGLPYNYVEIGATELFLQFRDWAEKQGERYYSQMSQTMFGRVMRERGFENTRGKSGHKVYRGIYPKLGIPAGMIKELPE